MTEERLNVFPSRMVLQNIKDRVKAARMGYSLLKRKSDAIKMRLNEILKEILDTKRRVAPILKDAAHAHTDAVWAGGDFNHRVIGNVSRASFRIKAAINNVAGVRLPVFTQVTDDTVEEGKQKLGLSKGGTEIAECAAKYRASLMDLIKLASLQTSLKTLDEALKITNRRFPFVMFVICNHSKFCFIHHHCITATHLFFVLWCVSVLWWWVWFSPSTSKPCFFNLHFHMTAYGMHVCTHLFPS